MIRFGKDLLSTGRRSMFIAAVLGLLALLLWRILDSSQDRREDYNSSRNGDLIQSGVREDLLVEPINRVDSRRIEGVVRRLPYKTVEEIEGIDPSNRRRDELLLMTETCGVEDLDRAWTAIEEAGLSKNDKIEVLQSLCRKLSGDGNVDEVLEKLDSWSVAGQDKNWLIRCVFGSSPVEKFGYMIAKLDGLEYGDEMKAAIEGLAGRVRGSVEDPPDISTVGKITDKDLSQKIGEAYGQRLLNVPESQKNREFSTALQAMERLVIDGKAPPEIINSFVFGAADTAPLSAWEFYEKRLGDDDESIGEEDGLGAKIAVGLIGYDGSSGMEKLIASDIGNSRSGAKLAGVGLYAWMKRDAVAAGEWIQSSMDNVSEIQSDFISQAMLQYSFESGDKERAQLWFDQISNEELRKQSRLMLSGESNN